MQSNQTESIVRLARRNLYVVLSMVLLFGATLMSNVLWPSAAFSQWPARAPWLIPMGIVFIAVAFGAGLRGRLNSPEVGAVLSDEWRQNSLTRAMRIAFAVVLMAQIPQALLLAGLPPLRAVMGMAIMTITLALAALITLFLVFDRDITHG